MKLFFVVGSFKMGGTERTASRIGIELLRRGYDIKFILINAIFDYNEPELLENSIVLVKDKTKNKTLRILSALFSLIRLLRKEKPAYLISFSMGINLFVLFTFYRRIIFRIESNIFIYRKKLYRRYLQKYAALSPNVKHVVVPSKGLYDKLGTYFLNPSKLVLISNPINIQTVQELGNEHLDDYPFLEPGKFIVTAGRLHYSKGFAQLIKIYAQSKLNGAFKLVILGDGPQKEELQNLIKEYKLSGNVFLLGYQSNPYRFFSRSRYFILNSTHESFGNVLIETMACDVPVISNDCDYGPRHIIKQNHNGILYDQRNEPGFLRVLEQAAFDDPFYQTLKKGAMEEKHRYDITTITDFWTQSLIV
jgi:glycosyltransferase involved in cell wall biosynthesis